MRRTHGKLIAIEGIDQSGKKTQTRLLAAEIRRMGHGCSLFNFPDYSTPLGRQLRAYLSGRTRLDFHAVHLLYAANRWETAYRIEREIDGGRIVIVNRYSPSNLAYGIAHGLKLGWLSALERGLPESDAVFILNISAATSFSRKRRSRDIHEGNLAYLKKVRNAYLCLSKKYHWKLIDGERETEIVQSDLWSQVSELLGCHMRGCG